MAGRRWLVAGHELRETRNPIRRSVPNLAMLVAGFLVPSAQAQLILERTVNVGQTITDRGQYVSTLVWENAGLSSVSRVEVSLAFTNASPTRPMIMGQFYGSLTHGTASEAERMTELFSPTNALSGFNPTYAVESALDGSWLASNTWSVLVADQMKGGGSAVWNSWKFRVEGAASGSTIAVSSGGTLLLGAANQIGDSTQVTMAGGTLKAGGFTDTAGRLSLTADSIFDFGTAGGSANSFTFADFDTSAYNGLSVLTIQNAAVGSSLVFNTDYSGNASFNSFASKVQFGTGGQFGQISFANGQTTMLVAIPDARIAWAAGLLCAMIGLAELRKRRLRPARPV